MHIVCLTNDVLVRCPHHQLLLPSWRKLALSSTDSVHLVRRHSGARVRRAHRAWAPTCFAGGNRVGDSARAAKLGVELVPESGLVLADPLAHAVRFRASVKLLRRGQLPSKRILDPLADLHVARNDTTGSGSGQARFRVIPERWPRRRPSSPRGEGRLVARPLEAGTIASWERFRVPRVFAASSVESVFLP
jgi:hypothetical protein